MIPHATTFRFLGYTKRLAKKEIVFRYEIVFPDRASLFFTDTIILPKIPKKERTKSIKKFLDPLGIILGIAYYKLYCPSKIELPFSLSKEQAEFWNTVYRKGLGEFLHRNNLPPDRIAKFPFKKISTRPIRVSVSDRALVGIGGGKDSIIATKLLKDSLLGSLLIEMQRENPYSDRVARALGNPILKIRRMIDSQMFEQEKFEGSYNGHTPLSALVAFLGLLSAALYDYRYFVVGNEQSSNVGNVLHHGEMVNHQWSKSAEFESLFQNYTKKFITPDITYFSLLRPFHEIRIVQLFAKEKEFFPIFTSCNKNLVIKNRPDFLWCGHCAKCAFVFLMLAPFLAKKELLKIFGKNLFADSELLPLYRDLLGFGTMKPFDCVGTFEESRAALFLASKKFKDDLVVQKFLPKIQNGKELAHEVLQTTPAPTLPTPFRLLGIESVGILGYGKEGRVTEKFLQKKYPDIKIGILDQSLDTNYLEKQKNFDLVVKTPGIPKEKVTVPYVTATNLFFAHTKNFTIGVTGSKGKSTTASLIFDILKAGGKKVRLLGNIGNPMLEVLSKKIDPEEIFVIELSSYMLEDIEYSPNIALLLNLFPEHMDHHGSIENYYRAKKNIFAFQKKGDIALKPPFTNIKIPIETSDIPLLGDHNLENIRAAMTVARHLNISEEAIRNAIKNFHPLPHRLEYIGTHQDILFYDDAISTTPQSTIAAIKTLKNIGTIFLGGEDRGYDFSELEKTLRKYKIENIVLFPNSGHRILASQKGFTVLETSSMEEAVEFAFHNTPKGKTCLLSTASPSYSLWKNFEEKGDLFQKFVKKFGK